MARASKRNIVMDTAERLFVQDGFAATGINKITDEAGIASMTLYNNFKSKDELILAILERQNRLLLEGLDSALEVAKVVPEEQMLTIFDYMESFMSSGAYQHQEDGSFTGCIFNHAVAEFRDQSHPVHQAATHHKQELLAIFENLAEEMKHPTPHALAQTLLLLLEGALSTAQVTGDMGMFPRARVAAQILLQSAI